jgi:hypothetical protein
MMEPRKLGWTVALMLPAIDVARFNKAAGTLARRLHPRHNLSRQRRPASHYFVL